MGPAPELWFYFVIIRNNIYFTWNSNETSSVSSQERQEFVTSHNQMPYKGLQPSVQIFSIRWIFNQFKVKLIHNSGPFRIRIVFVFATSKNQSTPWSRVLFDKPGALCGGKAAGAWSWPLTSIWCEVNNSWSYSSTPQCAFMVWCPVKAQGQLYIYLYLIKPQTITCFHYRVYKNIWFFLTFI